MANPKTAWCVVSSLQHSLADGTHGLSAVPKLLIRVIREELWREFYCEPMQSEVRHESFESYVTDDLPTGLGTTISMLKSLCQNDPAARDAIDRATKQEPGGGKNQHTSKDCLFNNVQEAKAPAGNSKDAALRRLRKDRPDLHEKVIEGQLSAHAAAVEAGFRKKPSHAETCVKAFRKAENRLEPLRLILADLEPHEAVVASDWIKERLG